jgi:hypothetical protein
MSQRRRAIAVACAAAIAVVVPSAVAPAVSQAAAYRYWSYWLGAESGWSFANVGPAFRVPADGTVEGWRFSVSGVEGNHAPSIAADFASVCGATPAEDARKRVAVIVDPGDTADAPDGDQPPGAWAMCVVAEERATGYDVLRAAATVRAERGLICAIGGYPARGCADVVADPAPTASPTPKPSKSPKPTPAPTASPDPGPTAAPGSPSSQPPAGTASADTAADADTSSAEPSSAVPTTATPTTAMPSTSSPAPELPPTPQPSYSLLTTPLEEPPSQGGGAGGALVAGIAVVGIAGLGAAAILRMRRSS